MRLITWKIFLITSLIFFDLICTGQEGSVAFGGVLSGQNKKMDSLNLAFKNASSDTMRLNVYENLCYECETNDNLKYGLPAINLAEKLLITTHDERLRKKILEQKAKFIRTVGVYFMNKNNYSKTIEVYQKLYPILYELKDTMNVEITFSKIADCILKSGNTTRAFDSLMTRLNYYETKDQKKFIGFYLSCIGEAYDAVNNPKRSLEYFTKGLNVYKELGNEGAVAEMLRQMAYQYTRINEPKKALECIFECLRITEKENNPRMTYWVYFRIIDIYTTTGLNDFKNALNYNAKCLDIASKLGDSTLIANAYTFFAVTYKKMLKYKEAENYEFKSYQILQRQGEKKSIMWSLVRLARFNFLLKKYDAALKYASESESIANEQKDIYQLKDLYLLKFEIYQAMGKNNLSIKYHLDFDRLSDSTKKIENYAEVEQKEMKYEFDRNEAKRLLEQEKKDVIAKKEKQEQAILRNSFIGGFILILIVALLIFRSYRQKQKANEELALKNETIAEQKHLVEEKQKEIIESITYAKRLQEAILPPKEFLDKNIPNNFILYKPKDLVAGDFYWSEKIESCFYIAAADSTGHGVPGAMVSVVCSNALNRTIKEFKETETGKILDRTRNLVMETFEKSVSEVKDGMDISLLCIDFKNKKVSWSGANNPLWYFEEDNLKEIKGDKQPIGKTEYPKPFTTHSIEYKEGTTFYLFTDGYADQFGGPNGKKFKYKQFSDLLTTNINLTLQQQSELINKIFEDWKGDLEQVDDVCIIGVRI